VKTPGGRDGRSAPRLPKLLVGMALVGGSVLVGSALCRLAAAQGAPSSPQDYLQRMDRDGDGRVSRAEYIAYMDRGFDRLDTDGNGVLEGDELPPGARRVTRADYEASLAAAFARQDTNHDGFLDARELATPPRAR
jgi:Ca2+-binding EF-hand superfamily protein